MDRITEKKLKNKRFRSTEITIISALLSIKDRISLSRLVRTAHVSRSTIYRHHKNVLEIVPNYEEYIWRKSKKMLMRLMKLKYIHLRVLYERILVILASNRQIMELILKHGDQNFIERLVAILKPKVLASSDMSGGEVYELYVKEVAGLIGIWCQAGFDLDASSALLDKITYLTETSHKYLDPLKRFDEARQRAGKNLGSVV